MERRICPSRWGRSGLSRGCRLTVSLLSAMHVPGNDPSRVTTFERESRTGVEPRWGCRALELGLYEGTRYKVIIRLRKTQPNKDDYRDTKERRNSCETEGLAGQETKVPKGAPQRAVTISAFQRPPQVSMT